MHLRTCSRRWGRTICGYPCMVLCGLSAAQQLAAATPATLHRLVAGMWAVACTPRANAPWVFHTCLPHPAYTLPTPMREDHIPSCIRAILRN